MQAAPRQVLHGHVPQAVANARVLRRVPGTTRLSLSIGLPLRNQEELEVFLQQLSDPDSPNYHQYKTAKQFAEQFGPAEADYQVLIDFVESHGLAVTGTHPNRTILDVAGTVADIEKTFHLNINSYFHAARGTFYAPDREPSLDLDIQTLDISGLDNFVLPHPMGIRSIPLGQETPFVTGSGPAGYFIGKDFRAAYAPGVTLNGAGQVVGLIEFDGFYASDIQANFTKAGLPPVVTETVLLNGFNGAAGGSNIEVTLDIMMAAYMAPGLTKVIVYEGTTPNTILNRMATDNLAQQLSSSWGFWPINTTTEQIFKQYIAQGQSFFQASGDSGAYKGGVMPPSDNPNLTVVGGTSLATSGSGGPWQAETSWPGSGGGVSTLYPIPSYQQGLSMAANGGSLTMRNIPDVALTSDIQMYLIQNNGQAVAVGGTSAAAPLWSGIASLANQKASASGRPRIGFVNPLIYSIGKGLNYFSDFHDIGTGNNSGFNAISGYDLVTGWGTPAGQHLIDDLSGVPGGPAFTLSASAGSLTVKAGSSGTSTVTVGPQNGFTGTVTLAATGMPSGVTASFSPMSITGTSMLTLAASSAAIAGTSTVTITGTSGALKSTTVISLSITVPGFTLSASPSSLTVKAGSNGTSTVTVAPQNGFTGSVTLAATGMPSGVTASFGPASITGTSILTLAANSAAVAGTSTVTVTGTSGTLKSTATIALSIVVPGFSLSASAGSLGILQGSGGASTIAVTPQNGFSASVSLAATGMPSGVTASFSPASITGTSTLTLAASSAAAASVSAVTITGTSGSLKSTVTIGVTVIVPSAGTVLVNLASAFNVPAMSSDGTAFTNSGLDGGLTAVATAYSANLIGAQQIISGTTFYFGPPDAPDAVSGKTVVLPSGQFSTLKLLATGVNGSQPLQTFTVTYADGTTSSYVQSLSDWFSPQSFAGEQKALSMAYRNNRNGVKDNRTFLLYGYSFNLNGAKKVSSIALPNNRNVVVLAMSLTGSGVPAPVPVNLTPSFDTAGISSDGKAFIGGLDGKGFAYSASLLGTTRTLNNATFNIGPPDAPDAVSGNGKAIALPAGKYSTLLMLGSAVNGSQAAQNLKVTYSDGTTSTVAQSFSDWFKSQSLPGESVAATMARRNSKNGMPDNGPFYLYGYAIALSNAKTVSSITMPNNTNVKVFALTLVP